MVPSRFQGRDLQCLAGPAPEKLPPQQMETNETHTLTLGREPETVEQLANPKWNVYIKSLPSSLEYPMQETV